MSFAASSRHFSFANSWEPWPGWQRFVFRYLLCHCLLYCLPEPIDGYQVYEADSGEYALTFPDDWTVGDASSISADAMLVGEVEPF